MGNLFLGILERVVDMMNVEYEIEMVELSVGTLERDVYVMNVE